MKRKLLKNNQKIIIACLLIGVLYCFLMPTQWSMDTGCWTAWTKWIRQDGFDNIYNVRTVNNGLNYHPFFMYVLYIFGKIFTHQAAVDKYIWVLKIFVLCFDLIGVILAMWFLKPVKRKPFYILMFLCNIGYMYNTVWWGQCDSIFTTFVCLSVYFLTIKPNLFWASLFYVLAIQTKMQAIIFLPIIGLLVLWHYREWTKADIRNSVLGVILLNFLIMLPFISTGSMPYLRKVYVGGIGFYTEITKGAFNIWTLILSEKCGEMHDTLTFLGISYHKYGLFMFCAASAIVLFPLLMSLIQKIKHQNLILDNQLVIITCALIPMVFYFFNTEMHERYIHPMVLFWGIFALQSQKLLPFLAASFLYFLNLERVLKIFQLGQYNSLIFDGRMIAAGYLILMLYGIFQLYHISQISINMKSLRENFNTFATI